MTEEITVNEANGLKAQPSPEEISEETLAQLLSGDISTLTVVQRNQFLWRLAKGLKLNPLTKPFDLIVLNNKLTVYANRTASDQLAQQHGISHEIVYKGPLMIGDQPRDDVYCVELKLKNKEGREEYSIGCVGIARLQGEALGNAIMKCHTKAKRRGILAMTGLGFLDELEVASVAAVAEETGRPGPRRVIPPPDASASPQLTEKNGPTQVVLPPKKGPA